MVNVKLCAVAEDQVRCPISDCFAAIVPQHHSSGWCFADTADTDHYFAFRVHCGSHSWQEVGWTPWQKENAHSQSCVHLKGITESPRLTRSNVTISPFNWVVCNACDSFTIKDIYSCDIQTQKTSSTAGVAQNRKGKLSRWTSCQPLTPVLQFSSIYWLHRARGGTQRSFCWKKTFIKYWYFGVSFCTGENNHIWLKKISSCKQHKPIICFSG